MRQPVYNLLALCGWVGALSLVERVQKANAIFYRFVMPQVNGALTMNCKGQGIMQPPINPQPTYRPTFNVTLSFLCTCIIHLLNCFVENMQNHVEHGKNKEQLTSFNWR